MGGWVDLDMRNILAKGGVEFLAVFLGIALSLWVDDVNKEKELEKQKLEVYNLLKKQTDELLLYTKSKLIEYERQADTFKNLIDNWESFNPDTVKDKKEFVSDIFFVLGNAYYPDFTTYETLMNSGEINLVDFNTIKMFGRLYKLMDDYKATHNKEISWRDFIEDRLLSNYSKHFKNYGLPWDILEFFQIAKNDDTIYAYLKSLYAIKKNTRSRVLVIEQSLTDIRDHLSNRH
tara:strand:+ start:80 stop:778 length:699 start_codon:yes stop_codon:yes gene_type:complete